MLENNFENSPNRGGDAPRRPCIVVLGTGGTIAGTASRADDLIGYTAGQMGVQDLLDVSMASAATTLGGPPGAGSGLASWPFGVHSEQLAQVDSKDMSFSLWQTLLQRVVFWLAQPDTLGLVITHGTDTLEETAYFLHRALPLVMSGHLTLPVLGMLKKPVVLTCAMRPATALDADGPQNLWDALQVAGSPDSQGVLVVCAGQIHHPLHLQKVHTERPDAFSSGDAGPLGHMAQAGAEGGLRNHPHGPVSPIDWKNGPLPQEMAQASDRTDAALENLLLGKTAGQTGCLPGMGSGRLEPLETGAWRWPRVEIIMSHAGASGAVVDALLAHSGAIQQDPSQVALRGIVVAATGNGTLHQALEAALLRAQAAGVQVVRSTRCLAGGVTSPPGRLFEDAGPLSPVKARIDLMLRLMAQGVQVNPTAPQTPAP